MPQIITVLTVLVVIAAAAVYWFGIRDDDKTDADKKPSSSTSDATLKEQDLKVNTIPFSFKYPGNFASAPNPPGVLWLAGISPVDIMSVRYVAPREYKDQGKLAADMKTGIEKPGTMAIANQSAGTAGGKPTVIYTVTSNAAGTPIQSRLIFFSASGKTWQVECQSQQSGREFIDAACDRAMETLTFQ
jgi:hypothetical protein